MTASELLSAIIFVLFVLLLVIGAISTLLRYRRYKRLEENPPRLLKRDAILLTGLALPFLLIAFVRATGQSAVVVGDEGPQFWWLLVTGIPPIVALAVYCYFELWVIERPK